MHYLLYRKIVCQYYLYRFLYTNHCNFSHTECHLSATQECNYSIYWQLNNSQRLHDRMWHLISWLVPSPPFSVWEFHFLLLSQAQPARKKFQFSPHDKGPGILKLCLLVFCACWFDHGKLQSILPWRNCIEERKKRFLKMHLLSSSPSPSGQLAILYSKLSCKASSH